MKRLKILLQSNSFYLFFLLILLFYVFFFTKVVRYQTSIPANTKEIAAKLVSFSIDGDKLNMILKDKEKIRATYYIKSNEEKISLIQDLKIGRILKLKGEKKDVIGMTIPNTFDYKKYLYNQHIYFCFQVSQIEILNTKIGFLQTIKNKMEMRIQSLGNNSYLRAFILGDKSFIASDEYDNIMENGVSHLFALSGMHLSLLSLFLSKILKKFKGKKIVIYLFLGLYLFITSFPVSFLRAILFMLLLDFNKQMGLSLSKLKVLCLTFFLLLLVNPFYVYNIGFWYTFIVTFSLLFCSSGLNRKNKILQIVMVSLITFLFSLPISIYLNYEINLLSIFNNIILVPFISIFVFPCALITFLFPIFFPIFQFFTFLLTWLNDCFAVISIPLVFGKIYLWEVFLFYFLLILSILFWSKKMFCLLSFFLFLFYNQNLFRFHYEVYFLDVGQGDATLFISPQNKEVILIDTGGNVTYQKKEYQIQNKEFNLADNIILFLKSKRIRKIDLLLITHGDKDHIGYAKDIGSKIKIKQVMLNKGKTTDLEKELIKKYKSINQYQSRCFDFQTYFLKIYNNENDNSILTKIKIFDYDFLLMGDASSDVEQDFIKKVNVSSSFLKVGHHGSNSSSSFAFLKNVNPNYAIISSGRNNRYHHPSKETIDNLKKLNISMLNTQEMGTIQVVIRKNGFHIKKTLA